MRRAATVLVIGALAVGCSGGTDTAGDDRRFRASLENSGYLDDSPNADIDALVDGASDHCGMFDRNPQHQQALWATIGDDPAGFGADVARFAQLAVEVYCPEHIAAAARAVDDLGG